MTSPGIEIDSRVVQGGRLGNLRPPSTSFHGRERDLLRLRELLETEWLVTLHGPGGTGKTRLAMRYGEVHPDDGVWFCDLTDAHGIAGICSIVALALDVALHVEQTTDAVVARLGRELDALGPALIIVDNCEQLVGEAASVLSQWHRAAPRVRFLVTSREVLRSRGESVHEVAPLSLPGESDDVASTEAVRLFVDRARAVRRDYVLQEERERIVAEIVNRLDGLPLAIELAAARMSVLGEQTILDRLQHRFDLLARGPRDTPARHRTLLETIDWSWCLLQPWEQAALEQCAVFRGGFTLEAAESVLDLSMFASAPAVLDVLQALKEKSLLRSDEFGAQRRFGMYESIGAFAEQKLEASAAARAAYRRHAAHYLNEADAELVGIDDHDDLDGVRRLAIEHDNLMAAHRRTVGDSSPDARRNAFRAMLALHPVLRERGSHDVHLNLLDATLGGPVCEDRGLFGRVIFVRMQRQWLRGRVAEAQADAETALHIGVAESDAWLEASAQQWLGVLESRRGRDAEAHARFTSARKRFASAGYAWREARVLGNMATAALNAGRVDEAHELYGEALAAFRRLADRNGIAATLAQMAHLLHDVGQLTKAEETFAEMLLLSRDLQLSMRGTAFGCMASLFHELGKLDEARHWYEQALALVHSFGHRRNECLFTAARGAVLASQDKLIEAGDAFDRATILLEGESDELGAVVRLHRGHVDLARSRACATEGDTRASSRYRDQADARLREDAGDATDDLRFATRLLRRSLAAPRASSVPALVVAPDGRWFQPDGEKRVDISRRKQLVRLLRALVRQHVERPGETMSVAALVRAAWPGERFAVERSAAMRVYVQLSRLRRLGLNDALRTVGDGYVLDPSVIVAESTRRVQ